MDGSYRIRVTKEQAEKVRRDEGEANLRERDQALRATENAYEPVLRGEIHEPQHMKHVVGQPKAGIESEDDYVVGHYVPPKAKDIEQLLEYTTVEHLLANHGCIVSLKKSDSVEHALKTFKEHEIHSTPVYDSDNKFLGLVDVRDILSYFCSVQHNDLDSSFFRQPVGNLIEISKTNPTPTVPIGTPLTEVAKILVQGEYHRVGVLDQGTHTLFNIVSQLSLVQFIAKNISLVPETLRKSPVSSFMQKIVNVNTIPGDTPTGKAFEYLHRDGISAAAVVDPLTGRVIDTFSSTDLVGVVSSAVLVEGTLAHLDMPVAEFLASTRRTKALKPPITCQVEDSYEYSVLKLASTKVHRLWVVDPVDERYLGFVSLSNVLSHLLNSSS